MSKTILVVDDSASLRMVVTMALTGAGYEVIEAEDGEAALHYLDGRKVHLIISDVHMPNLDGLGLVRAVKQLPRYRFMPIIMLTTEDQANMIEEGMAMGVKAWMLKPFQPSQMLAAVGKLVLPF